MENTSLEKEEKKKGGVLQWVLFAFIPLLVIAIAILIVSMVAGVNVFDKAKEIGDKIPIVSKLTGGSSEPDKIDYEGKIIELEGKIRDRETMIAQLEAQMEQKDDDIKRAQLEKEQIEESIKELESIQSNSSRAFKDIIKTYETMSAKKAAPILTEMKTTEALQILSNIKADTLSAILEKMEPKDAANFTELLAAEKSSQN